MVWLSINSPQPQQQNQPGDSTHTMMKKAINDSIIDKPITPTINAEGQPFGKYFSHLIDGELKTLVIETEYYKAEITTQGGAIQSWELNNYKTWNHTSLNLINTDQGGDFHLLFCTSDGKLINTKDLKFSGNFSPGKILTLGEKDSASIQLFLRVDEKRSISKTLVFYGNRYSFDVFYKFENMENIIANFSYQVTWESGLRYAERNSVDESNYAKALASVGGELPEIDATKFNESVQDSNISGRAEWIATRTKYFLAAIIPREKESQRLYLEGIRTKLPNEGMKENYTIALEMPFKGQSIETDKFTVYLGPLDIDVLKEYRVGLEKTISLGIAWLIRPISEYLIIPLFKFLRYFIPNFGIVMIVFSLIIKIVLHPLTKSSMKSMQKMQTLQPMMNEIKEKYKDDPQKMNQQVMRLYKEYGVNPAGGCLPLLLQLPILYALWAVFSSAIQLRQASFVWWIQDLAIPDVIARLPFRIPIFNINEISGLALLMGITMLVQQKMSVKDPRQKMMVWMMPILMTLMFNGFPAGLNLYYFIFNLLSIGQQAWINKQHKDEPLRKVEPKKGNTGWINRIAKDLPRKS
jgi:YidC/Oxa1 family membrane protein insertase